MNEQQAVLQASGLTKRFAEGQIDVAVPRTGSKDGSADFSDDDDG